MTWPAAGQRTLEAAAGLLRPAWERLLAGEPCVAALFEDKQGLTAWRTSARDLLAG